MSSADSFVLFVFSAERLQNRSDVWKRPSMGSSVLTRCERNKNGSRRPWTCYRCQNFGMSMCCSLNLSILGWWCNDPSQLTEKLINIYSSHSRSVESHS